MHLLLRVSHSCQQIVDVGVFTGIAMTFSSSVSRKAIHCFAFHVLFGKLNMPTLLVNLFHTCQCRLLLVMSSRGRLILGISWHSSGGALIAGQWRNEKNLFSPPASIISLPQLEILSHSCFLPVIVQTGLVQSLICVPKTVLDNQCIHF